MRVFILVIFISAYIITPKNASAQFKSVLGDSSTSWSMITSSCIDNYWSENYYYTKDTLINEATYRIISAGRYSKIYLREDTVSGKLWAFDEDIIKREYLVMDMSLQQGDSFPFYSTQLEETYFLPVDSVYYESGNKVILFDYYVNCSYKEKLRFIEGTGPSVGFLNGGDEISTDGYILCHFKDNKRVFTSKRFKDYCSIDSWIGIKRDFRTEMNINVYPNPTNGTGIIAFQNDENACLNLEIYDLNGKRIFTNSSKNAYITFDLNAFEQGVYVYKLMNEKGEFSSGRILKQ